MAIPSNEVQIVACGDSLGFIRTLIKRYAELLLTLLGLIPSFAIAYLYFFQDPTLRFEHHSVHEIAIGISMLQSGFIAYVTYCCYRYFGEPFLRWLTLGFLGFTIIYGLHGAFTRFTHDHLMLFILYGPASRLVMAACLLAGLMTYGRQKQPTPQIRPIQFWLVWLGAFAVIDVLVGMLALSAWAGLSRWIMEIGAMAIMLSCALTILVRRIRSPLMVIYAFSRHIFCPVVHRLHAGIGLESHVVAGSRYFCNGFHGVELWCPRGVPDHGFLHQGLQSARTI